MIRRKASRAAKASRRTPKGTAASRTVRTRRNGASPPSAAQDGVLKVDTAIRAWVEPHKAHKRRSGKPKNVAWRPQPYGDRVLVFDTETTTDAAQRLLFGFFRLYERDRLIEEGLIVTDLLDYEQMTTLTEYAVKCHLPIYSRERFVEERFYPEVYCEGTVCVGFHLPFDLTRIAVHAGIGRGENRRKFRLVLSKRIRWHDLRIESASGRAAFIGFTPKRKLLAWEKPFFKGRFLDLSTLSAAFTGKRHTLKSAVLAFRCLYPQDDCARARARSTGARCSTGARTYVQPGRCTRRCAREYERHPFATFAHECTKPKTGRYMGELYSSASIAKQYLRLMGIEPLLQSSPGSRASCSARQMPRTSVAGLTCACARRTPRYGCSTSRRTTPPSLAFSGSTSCSSPRRSGSNT